MLRDAIKLNIYAKRYSLLRANVFRCCNQKELYQNKCDSIDVKKVETLVKRFLGTIALHRGVVSCVSQKELLSSYRCIPITLLQ